MALRNIVKKGDPILNKVCRPVEKYDEKLAQLIDDMLDTLQESGGVGLAAPQVGILRRVVVIDVGDGPIELVNPKITAKSGSQYTVEGCLSCPEDWGYTTRPQKVTVEAYDRNGKLKTYKGKDLLAKAFCHELDHLDGHLFTEIIEERVDPKDLK